MGLEDKPPTSKGLAATEKGDTAMIDRRSLTDHHPSLAGTDYVLEGASVRDRFLTAFILQRDEAFQSAWLQAVRLPDRSEPTLHASLFSTEESFSVRDESDYEPVAIQVIEDWSGADDDDDM
jgi:hypothetical protein